MKSNTIQTLLRSVIKIGGGALISSGFATGSDLQIIGAGIATLIAVIWGVLHRTSGDSASPSRPANAPLFALAFILLCIGLVGCASNTEPKRKVIAGSGELTSLGLTENPITGVYELGAKRGQMSFIVVPAVYNTNNGVWSTPDMVMSVEAQARNGVFGSAGGTTTFAVGSNSVQTLLGGQHLPINATLVNSTNIGSAAPLK